MPGYPHSGPSQNVRNFNGRDQGPSTNGRGNHGSNYYGTTHTPPYGTRVGHGAGYDTRHAPQQYPGFVPQQSPRHRFMTPPRSRSQDSADVWDPFGGSRPFHILNEDSRATNVRKALVIGTNFPLSSDPRKRLQCCTEDAYCVADFLRDVLGFAQNDIRIITDDYPDDLPTKENIIKAMKTLVRGAQPGDSFFFYFSGHGMQIKDLEGDEIDGLDECICAMDYRGDELYQDCNTPGLIVDDTMHEIMVAPLPRLCRLTAVFDCCHSGTILDLPVVYNSKGAAKPYIHPDGPWVRCPRLSSADVVSLSASKDNQEAAESPQGGALRWAFIDSVCRYGNTLTYNTLVWYMRDYMARHGLKQKPQLSASHRIDTNWLFVV
ncbi:caspase domain-containing protein [Russula aff. rugulosa BPL654]|nr:caspase domain-containing protein [Russula aff. rugulosa BPL654]